MSPSRLNRQDADIEHIVRDVVESYRTDPVDLLQYGLGDGEYHYLQDHLAEYVRTVKAVSGCFSDRAPPTVKILEIGAFLGIASIALSRLGYQVVATDIGEFLSCANLTRKLTANGVSYAACNLSSYRLPFDDGAFDAVVMCETLEHLNFNPLPVVLEINRVTKQDGLLYLALPNIARRGNRQRLLDGRSIHNPISHFFLQLDPTIDNMIVGLHWREYTIDEVREMLERLDFLVLDQHFDPKPVSRSSWKWLLKRPLGFILSLRPVRRVVLACLFDDADRTTWDSQVTIARKAQTSTIRFHFTDATLPK